MHEFSRALYRDLAPRIIRTCGEHESDARRRVLEGCETTMRRMIREPDLHDPARLLFKHVRTNFRFADQRWVRETVERHVEMYTMHVATEPGILDPERACLAYNRQGNPCEREPMPGQHYCPSHKDWIQEADEQEPARALAVHG